ncbi:DUF2147 domain-containing protein [Rhodopseudomonas sp. B29]|uniref:DUF2147 domain-containing protein n=1 Tax=Rhodopseudomonas sp. B29 TaxID=95607 RepID=UPI0003B69C87|nr:DUF2147 domain-containing protein [Rhodopseudomonas sp. B29]
MMTARPIRLVAMAFAASLAMLTAAAAQPAAGEATAVGLWQRVEKPQTWVLILDRGNNTYEGVVVKTFPDASGKPGETICRECSDDRKDQPILGISLIRDMKRKGRKYEGGTILDPRNGDVWSAMLTISPDNQTMTLRGYLGTPMLGQDDTWKRLPDTAVAQIDPAIVAKFMPERAADAGVPPKAATTAVAKPKAAPMVPKGTMAPAR